MPVLDIIRWVAAGAAMIAAIIIAARLSPRTTGFGFVIFTVSSLLWVGAGYLSSTPSLVAQNAILTAVNLFGVYRWLIVRS
jgi:hypothetical protein